MKRVLPILMSMFLISACGGQTEKTTPKTEIVKPESKAVANKPSDDGAKVFASLPTPYNEANYDNGKRVYRLCVSCHLLKKDGGHRVGPNLHGIIGRQAGSVDGFRFSRVVIESGIVWTPEKIDEWLSNPRSFLPGNRMSFSGVRKPKDRQDVIAYIMYESAKD